MGEERVSEEALREMAEGGWLDGCPRPLRRRLRVAAPGVTVFERRMARELLALRAEVDSTWRVLGLDPDETRNDPDVATLPGAVAVTLQYERDTREMLAEAVRVLRAREERLRAALSALVRAIEDTWTHEDDCPAADGDDAPEDAECQCMPMAVDDAFAALAGTAINSDAPPREAGDPELAAAVARLDAVVSERAARRDDGVAAELWRDMGANGGWSAKLDTGDWCSAADSLRDVLIALAADVGEQLVAGAAVVGELATGTPALAADVGEEADRG